MLLKEKTLHDLMARIIAAAGSDASETAIVADHLLRANLTGHDSHGAGMLATYMQSIKAGLLKPNTAVSKVTDSGAILVFDGGRGYGQRVAREAMEQAIARCRETGVVLMALRNAHHIGRIGSYGEQSIEAGLISLHFVNVTDHPPLVTAHNGGAARFLTNPICFAIPGTDKTPPALLDMATSKVALGKARVALYAGKQLPEGSLIDADGQPTTDPRVLMAEPRGALRPFGAYKGYGIAFFCELLAGALTGGGTMQPGNPRHGSIVNNMLTIVIDPARLVDLAFLRAEIDAMTAYVLSSPPAADADEDIMIAGEPERRALAKRRKEGIPMDDNTWKELLAIAAGLGVRTDGLQTGG